MASVGDRVQSEFKASSAYDAFRVDDHAGKRVGEARRVYLSGGEPAFVEVELRGLFGNRLRLVPWEIVRADDGDRRIRLRCAREQLEDLPVFDERGSVEQQGQRARKRLGLPPELPSKRVERPDDEVEREQGVEPQEPNAGAVDAAPAAVDGERNADADAERPRDDGGAERSLESDLAPRARDSGAPTAVLAHVDVGPQNDDDDPAGGEGAEEIPVAAATPGEPAGRSAFRRRDPGEEAFPLGSESSQGWHPPFDVAETEDGYRIAVDVPGVEPDALQVTLDQDDLLTVTGERDGFPDSELQRRERPTGRFVRRFRLPPYTAPEAVAAELRNGVLELHVSRTAPPEARRIALRGFER